jgi:N-acyl-D-aspartate/D-glutamate deacylase
MGPAAGRQAPAAEGDRLPRHVVAGAVTYRDGEATGALPGRLVRGPQQAA